MEEKNNNRMSELVKLMHKAGKAMEMTRDKKLLIDIMKEDLMNETRPVRVEQSKVEISEKEQEKAEFDEITVEALRKAKTEILKIREQSEKEYQEKLIETMEKKKQIEKKLQTMEKKGLPEEKISMARNSASKALEKANNDMKEYQDKHFVKRAKLDEFEADINNYAVELGVDIEPIKEEQAEVEGETVEAPKTTKTETQKPQKAQDEAVETQTTNLEETKIQDAKKEEKEDAKVDTEKSEVAQQKVSKSTAANKEEEYILDENNLPKVAFVEVKDNKYTIAYETKENGVYSIHKKECEKLGFFKNFVEKAKLVVNREEYGLDLMSAIRVDMNIFRNLNEKDQDIYLDYLVGDTANCFDITYDNEKNRYAKALAKGREWLALREAEALEQYGPVQDETAVDLKQQIEDKLIAPQINKTEHQQVQAKYDRMFGKGFDQHSNPPVVQNGKAKGNSTTDREKEGSAR